MRAVEVGSHKTVEKTVVTVGELLLERVGCPSEPIDKALPYLLNLGVRHLYGVPVPHLYSLLVALGIKHRLTLVDVGYGVVQGVLQEVDAVIASELALHGILVPDIGILLVTDNGILVHIGMVGHTDVRLKELRGEPAIDFGRYPSLAEVEVQIGKGDGCRRGSTQGGKALLRFLMLRMVQEPRLDTLRLLYHVARNELIGYLVAVLLRIVEDTSLQG